MRKMKKTMMKRTNMIIVTSSRLIKEKLVSTKKLSMKMSLKLISTM
jgi:hypothetical protein